MVIWWYFCFLYHMNLYTMQKPSYMGRNVLVSIWSRMAITQIIIWACKNYLTFMYPSNMNISIDITIFGTHGQTYWYHNWHRLPIPCIHLHTTPTLVCTPINPINMDDHLRPQNYDVTYYQNYRFFY